MKLINNRRKFFKDSIALSATAFLPSFVDNVMAAESAPRDSGKNCTFLFQGDSITDGARSRNMDWNHVMGHGYAFAISSRLWFDFPKKGFHFFNRGVGGNTIVDMQKRWQADTLDLKPDVLSILIGVNDTSHYLRGDKSNTVEQFATIYRELIEQTKKQLPHIVLVLCEPFILPVGNVKERWEEYQVEVKQRQEIVRKLATDFQAIFVPFQDTFNEALKRAPAEYWIWDGVHPMPAGHELMAREWIKSVSKTLKFIK